MKKKLFLLFFLFGVGALLIFSVWSSKEKIAKNYISTPCPNMPPDIEKGESAGKELWEKVQKAEGFKLGETLDLGFYKVTVLKAMVSKEYDWEGKTVRSDCPFLIVEMEIEKTKLETSKERFNPLFLSVSKKYPPGVSLYAIFSKHYYTRSCDFSEGETGFTEEEPVGTKKKGRCIIHFREDWGKERYLVIQLSETTKGTIAFLPIPLSQTKILSLFKLKF